MREMVVSAFCFAVMAAFTRMAGVRLPVQEIVLARAAIAIVLTILLARRARVPLVGRRQRLLVFRGLTGFLSLSCYFWSVVHLPFAEAVLLLQVNPVFTALFAWWFLGEAPGARFVPAALLVFAGVFLVVPPDLTSLAANQWTFVGLAGAFFAGSAYTEVRALSRTEHPLIIVLWFQVVSFILAVPGTLLSGPVAPRGLDWAWLAGVGLTGQAGQVFLTQGLAKVPAGRGTLANPLVVAFGAALGWLLFGEALHWGDALGVVALVAGLLLAGSAGSVGPGGSGRLRPEVDTSRRGSADYN